MQGDLQRPTRLDSPFLNYEWLGRLVVVDGCGRVVVVGRSAPSTALKVIGRGCLQRLLLPVAEVLTLIHRLFAHFCFIVIIF